MSVNFIHAVCSGLSTPSDAGLALAWHGPIQCDPVCCGTVQHFIHKCMMTSLI
jgi:hypothetical protein